MHKPTPSQVCQKLDAHMLNVQLLTAEINREIFLLSQHRHFLQQDIFVFPTVFHMTEENTLVRPGLVLLEGSGVLVSHDMMDMTNKCLRAAQYI